jgi:hypothetical protein
MQPFQMFDTDSPLAKDQLFPRALSEPERKHDLRAESVSADHHWQFFAFWAPLTYLRFFQALPPETSTY